MNGNVSKLEKIVDLLLEYDIIYLYEIKTAYPFSVPGFLCFRSLVIPGEELRGGVAVLVKEWIFENYLYDINQLRDQVWFRLHLLPDLLLGAIYIPPHDSPYFSNQCFASFQEQGISRLNSKLLILGDLNARIGQLEHFDNPEYRCTYTNNPDSVINSHGRVIVNMAKNLHLVPINHLQRGSLKADGGLTYRQGSLWKSQIDWALCSLEALDNVKSFQIDCNFNMLSNHAPLVIEIEISSFTSASLLERSRLLKSSVECEETNVNDRKVVKFDKVDPARFVALLPDPWLLIPLEEDPPNIDLICDAIERTLYITSGQARLPLQSSNVPDPQENRWKWLMEQNDPWQIWAAINWKGTFDQKMNIGPSTSEQVDYFKNLLSLNNSDSDNNNENNYPLEIYIPDLDDPITEREVNETIKLLKSNKAAGLDGISPGLLKLLDATWISFITYILNIVFYVIYPTQWTMAKLFTIFKGGDPKDPGNYRGINIMAALPKLYDSIITTRLQRWFSSDEEQAGAKKGRGCEEQILALRLLIDIARKEKGTLYVLFVDFEKAYDRVDRKKLIELLKSMGCGSNMTQAIEHSLKSTTSVINNMSVEARAGVRQGSPSSCFLFTAYVNSMIRMVKEYGEDGWLGPLIHLLLLMDDTVLFSTTREGIMWKFQRVLDYCSQFNMKINEKKTKFMTVNTNDHAPLTFDELTVLWCDRYVYLGNLIMNAPVHVQVEQHLKSSMKNIHKFQSFLSKNADAPYYVKSKVWSAALNSSVFYGAETWWSSNLRAADKLHISSLRDLLGVRTTVCSDVVYLETGIPSAIAHIKQKQIRFLNKLKAWPDYNNSYLQKIISKAIEVQSPMGKYMQMLDQIRQDPVDNEIKNLQRKINENMESSRRMTYKELNPDLVSPTVYHSRLHLIEHHRIAYTRFRLGSHRFKIETGRWSRIPRERRLCPCGEVQDEAHVLQYCPLLRDIRRSFSEMDYSAPDTVMKHEDIYLLSKYLYFITKRVNEINENMLRH